MSLIVAQKKLYIVNLIKIAANHFGAKKSARCNRVPVLTACGMSGITYAMSMAPITLVLSGKDFTRDHLIIHTLLVLDWT